MLKSLMHAIVGRFQKRYDYDVSYMRALIAADPAAFLAFSKVQGLGGYAKAPKAAIIAAKLVATLAEDCGPCTQIVIRMGEEQGVPASVLKAVLTGDEAAMGADAALAWKFARASLARDMEAADPLREEVVARWGEKGLATLALAIASSRVYPTVKYALGYGKTCSRVQVKGEGVSPLAA
ncbi:MAG TPA: hypothetical protein VD906_16515 [Caulobacteraceae bacterium]|nr:hypothetical protein [Caulobacteraceae bacterium]